MHWKKCCSGFDDYFLDVKLFSEASSLSKRALYRIDGGQPWGQKVTHCGSTKPDNAWTSSALVQINTTNHYLWLARPYDIAAEMRIMASACKSIMWGKRFSPSSLKNVWRDFCHDWQASSFGAPESASWKLFPMGGWSEVRLMFDVEGGLRVE